MKAVSEYAQKLRDPRWQKRRLEILERDNWTCQKCCDTESTLVVHHRDYLRGKDPWDYPDSLLVTLCEDCHEGERLNRTAVENGLLEALREVFFAEDIHSLMLAFRRMELSYRSEDVAAAYACALQDPELQRVLVRKYFDVKVLAVWQTEVVDKVGAGR